jgi:chromosome segregation ATPase
MDPDTTKKVSELLNLMEDISSDVDTKSGLAVLSERVEVLENKMEELARRFEQLEQLYQEKRMHLRSLKQELRDLFPENPS